MNYKSLVTLALLLVATGCSSAVSDRSQSLDSARSTAPSDVSSASSPDSSPAADSSSVPPAVSQPAKPSLSGASPQVSPTAPIALSPKRQSSSSNESRLLKPDPQSGVEKDKGEEDNVSANIKRDYAPTTPIDETGKVTVRDRIRFLETDRLIADCPTDTAPFALAESTNYRIQICSEEYDPQLPKYYIGQAKDGSGELRITSANLDEARQLIFKNDDYTYVLYQDGARPEQTNAYLEVYEPNGESYAEALFYLYR
jgi:hypothetical protein